MNRVSLSATMVGNEFVLQKPRLRVAMPMVAAPIRTEQPSLRVASIPAIRRDFNPPEGYARLSPVGRFVDLLHRYSLSVFALLFLLVGGSGAEVLARYYTTHQVIAARPVAVIAGSTAASIGLNTTVPSYQLGNEMQTVTTQPATLSVGSQTLSISYDTIKSWLEVAPDSGKTVYSIHVNPVAIASSLANLASQYAKAPVDQITTNPTDGTAATVIVPGVVGTALSDPSNLTKQAEQISKTLLNGKGFRVVVPLKSVAYSAVAVSSLSNLVDINTATGQLSAYQNGQLVNSFPIATDATTTQTTTGEFQIWKKLPSATLVNYNARGTRHTDFSVPSYLAFDHSGDAVCGITTATHGCLGLQPDQAQWLYSWAPINATVAIHD